MVTMLFKLLSSSTLPMDDGNSKFYLFWVDQILTLWTCSLWISHKTCKNCLVSWVVTVNHKYGNYGIIIWQLTTKKKVCQNILRWDLVSKYSSKQNQRWKPIVNWISGLKDNLFWNFGFGKILTYMCTCIHALAGHVSV